MIKPAPRWRNITKMIMLVGMLLVTTLVLSACGAYGLPQYPDGKSTVYRQSN